MVLRVVAASYLDVDTDEMVYSIIPLNIISAGRLGTVEQSPLYFYLADVVYIFGGGLGTDHCQNAFHRFRFTGSFFGVSGLHGAVCQ